MYRTKIRGGWAYAHPGWLRFLEDKENSEIKEGSLEVYANEYGELVSKDDKPVVRLRPQTFYN